MIKSGWNRTSTDLHKVRHHLPTNRRSGLRTGTDRAAHLSGKRTIQTTGLLLRNAHIKLTKPPNGISMLWRAFRYSSAPVRSHLVSAAEEAHSPVDVDV